MSICPSCSRHTERASPHAHLTHEYYEVLIKPLRHVAERCGYALAVHGSLNFDIDLVACPWRDTCVDAGTLAESIRKAAEQIIGLCYIRDHELKTAPTQKPCGRLAWSFYLNFGAGPYIDLSVMPKVRTPEEVVDKQGGIKCK